MGVLVTYATNNDIKYISNIIAKHLNADVEEIYDLKIKPGFLNNIRNNIDAIRSTKTVISPKYVDFTGYDLILLGTPSVYANPTPAIKTFIEYNDFKNKDVIIYVTTHSKAGTSVLRELKILIEQKGGRIINSFIVRVDNKDAEQLRINTLKLIYKLDLDIYVND